VKMVGECSREEMLLSCEEMLLSGEGWSWERENLGNVKE
jgi:hypothetical protein